MIINVLPGAVYGCRTKEEFVLIRESKTVEWYLGIWISKIPNCLSLNNIFSPLRRLQSPLLSYWTLYDLIFLYES